MALVLYVIPKYCLEKKKKPRPHLSCCYPPNPILQKFIVKSRFQYFSSIYLKFKPSVRTLLEAFSCVEFNIINDYIDRILKYIKNDTLSK